MRTAEPKRRRSFLNFGFSTILVSFVMICVITFSVLALVTAHSDYKLSDKVAGRTLAYYEAEEEAYTRLAEIDAILAESFDSGAEKGYQRRAADALTAYGAEHPGLSLALAEEENQLSLTYRVPVTESQNLIVGLTVLSPRTSGGVYYRLTRWQTENTQAVETEEPLKLIGT